MGVVSIVASAVENGLRIDLLGRFRVALDGHPIDAHAWPSRRAMELVQLLALAEGHQLMREVAIEALWPRLGADAGGANLRKAAHHARKALGTPNAIVLRAGRVALLPQASVTTDVELFEAEARAALATDDRQRVAAAVELCAGTLLPDALYEDWTQAPRARTQALLAALLRRSEQWERLVELDPTDEPAHRELIRRALAVGSRPAAIRWYGRLRSNLRRELGLSPSVETQALYERCVSGLVPDEPELVGRDLELATATAFLRSGADAPDALIVRGPAGIGKSALCGELSRQAGAAGRNVVSVTATEGGAPYAPIAAAVERLASDRLDALPDHARSVLAELTPLIASESELGRPPTRHEVIGAVRRLLLASSAAEGALVVIDDAHLADEATIDLLLHLDSADRRILLVIAYRAESAPDALTRGIARWARAGRTAELDLGPLGHDAAVALVAETSNTPRAPDVIDRIVELTEGNPFLMLEVARSPVAGVPSLTPTGADAVLARLADLDPAVTAVLKRLALAGDALEPAAAVALSGTVESQAFVALDRALDAGVLVVAGVAYRFRHELVRRALISAIRPHERVIIHRQMAATLADAGASPRVVARQWLEGSCPDEAQPWQLEAGKQAMRLGAYRDALIEIEALIEHAPDHREALSMRAEALDAVGDAAAPAAFERAAVAAGGDAAHELRAKAALATIKLGDPATGLEILGTISPATPEGRLAEALAHCGAAALGFADPEVGSAKAAQVRRLAIECGDTQSLVVASWANAAAAHARGDLRNSVEADLHETHALPRLAVSVFDGQLCITQRLLYGARPYGEVIAFAKSLAAEAERLGAARGSAFAVTIRGEARLLAGDLEAADADLARGVELHRRIGAATGEAFALQRRAEVALYRGDDVEAKAFLEMALAIARESDVGFHLLDRIYGARVNAAANADAALAVVEEAEDAVRGPIETCPGCRITLAVPAAIAASRGGDTERADRWVRESEYLANVVMRLPAWDAALEEVRGHRALAGGGRERAREHFAAAAAGFRGAGQPLDYERCAALEAEGWS